MVTVVHLGLAVALFFLVNWIGRHSLTFGYVQLSAFEGAEEAPAMNFAIRFAGPLVFLVVISAILFGLGLDPFVTNIYWVVIYYFIFRFVFNIALERHDLINWKRGIVTALFSIGSAYLLYANLISIKQRLIPDVATIANELWVIIAVFLFTVFNNVELDGSAASARVSNFQRRRYKKFVSEFGSIVDKATNDTDVRRLIYSIMIYESFNRPTLARVLERLLFGIGRSSTLGVMQVKTDRMISDKESVKLGAAKIVNAYSDFYKAAAASAEPSWNEPYWIAIEARRKAIANYNPDDTYVDEVTQIFDALERDVPASPIPVEVRQHSATTRIVQSFSLDRPIFRVKSVDEFFEALGPDRIIDLAPGNYDLGKTKLESSAHVRWSREHDGQTLTLFGLNNLTIQGSKGTKLVVKPRYPRVLSIERCEGIELSSMMMGHEPAGYCTGGVLEFEHCEHVRLRDVRLFGCGTEGLSLNYINDFVMDDSEIFDCVSGISTIRSSSDVYFHNSRFYRNGNSYGFSFMKSYRAKFVDCEIFENKCSGELFETHAGETIKYERGRIESNRMLQFGDAQFYDCNILNNQFGEEKTHQVAQSPQ